MRRLLNGAGVVALYVYYGAWACAFAAGAYLIVKSAWLLFAVLAVVIAVWFRREAENDRDKRWRREQEAFRRELDSGREPREP